MRQTLDGLGQKEQRLAPKQLQFAAVYRTAAPSPSRSVFLSPERSVSREHRQRKQIILQENSVQVAGAGRRSTIHAITSRGPCVLGPALSTYLEMMASLTPHLLLNIPPRLSLVHFLFEVSLLASLLFTSRWVLILHSLLFASVTLPPVHYLLKIAHSQSSSPVPKNIFPWQSYRLIFSSIRGQDRSQQHTYISVN